MTSDLGHHYLPKEMQKMYPCGYIFSKIGMEKILEKNIDPNKNDDCQVEAELKDFAAPQHCQIDTNNIQL